MVLMLCVLQSNERELEDARLRYREAEERLFDSQNVVMRLNKVSFGLNKYLNEVEIFPETFQGVKILSLFFKNLLF